MSFLTVKKDLKMMYSPKKRRFGNTNDPEK